MPVQVLKPLAVPKSMQAQRMDPGAPPGVSVIGSRAAPIPVEHQSLDGSMKAGETILAAAIPEVEITADLPPDAGVAMAAPDLQLENGVGVSPERVVQMTRPEPRVSQVIQPQKTPTTTTQQPPQRQPVPRPQPQAQPQRAVVKQVEPTPRIRVRISNAGMGRITTTVRAVSISDTCIILAYAEDAENIVEPPVCGSDSPITVEYDGKKFLCVFGGWTAELDGSFLVILLRAEDAQA